VTSLEQVAVSEEQERRLRMGQHLELEGLFVGDEIAAIAEDGSLVGVLRRRGEKWKPEVVLTTDALPVTLGCRRCLSCVTVTRRRARVPWRSASLTVFHRSTKRSIARLGEIARRHKAHATVVTFDPHPGPCSRANARRCSLARSTSRLEGLERLGVEQVRILGFDEELSARECDVLR